MSRCIVTESWNNKHFSINWDALCLFLYSQKLYLYHLCTTKRLIDSGARAKIFFIFDIECFKNHNRDGLSIITHPYLCAFMHRFLLFFVCSGYLQISTVFHISMRKLQKYKNWLYSYLILNRNIQQMEDQQLFQFLEIYLHIQRRLGTLHRVRCQTLKLILKTWMCS